MCVVVVVVGLERRGRAARRLVQHVPIELVVAHEATYALAEAALAAPLLLATPTHHLLDVVGVALRRPLAAAALRQARVVVEQEVELQVVEVSGARARRARVQVAVLFEQLLIVLVESVRRVVAYGHSGRGRGGDGGRLAYSRRVLAHTARHDVVRLVLVLVLARHSTSSSGSSSSSSTRRRWLFVGFLKSRNASRLHEAVVVLNEATPRLARQVHDELDELLPARARLAAVGRRAALAAQQSRVGAREAAPFGYHALGLAPLRLRELCGYHHQAQVDEEVRADL